MNMINFDKNYQYIIYETNLQDIPHFHVFAFIFHVDLVTWIIMTSQRSYVCDSQNHA